MKKILILANSPGGLYRFRKELIQSLINEGNKIYISLPYGKLVEPLVEIGCEFIETPIDRRGINPIKDFKLILNYKKIVRKIKPDLILTYTIKPNIYGGLVSRMFKIPYIVNITGLGTAFQGDGILKKFIILLYKLSLGKVRYVFFENKGNKQVFINNKIIKENIGVVMNGAGVNLEEYQFTQMPKGEAIRFLFIGRVMKEKGIDELFEVAKKIKKEYKNVEFDIVGPFEDKYEDIVNQLQQERIINYHGYQEDVKSFIKECDCFILPSYHEGMSNAVLEAASMGRPLIVSNIYGCKEAIDINENGFICDVKSVDSLYSKVVEFIKIDYGKRIEMGKKSRQHIVNNFNKKQIVKDTVKRVME